MNEKNCKTCPYLVGNEPYYCELGDVEIIPELVVNCMWYPEDEIKLREYYDNMSREV